MTTKAFSAFVLSSAVAFGLAFATTAQSDPAAATVATTIGAATVAEAKAKIATPAPEMQAVLEKLAELGAKPLPKSPATSSAPLRSKATPTGSPSRHLLHLRTRTGYPVAPKSAPQSAPRSARRP